MTSELWFSVPRPAEANQHELRLAGCPEGYNVWCPKCLRAFVHQEEWLATKCIPQKEQTP